MYVATHIPPSCDSTHWPLTQRYKRGCGSHICSHTSSSRPPSCESAHWPSIQRYNRGPHPAWHTCANTSETTFDWTAIEQRFTCSSTPRSSSMHWFSTQLYRQSQVSSGPVITPVQPLTQMQSCGRRDPVPHVRRHPRVSVLAGPSNSTALRKCLPRTTVQEMRRRT
jgi:hypothetical protein